jgi:hypothetical protein
VGWQQPHVALCTAWLCAAGTAGDQCKGSWPDSVMDRYICHGAAFEAALPFKAADADMYKCKDKPPEVLPRYLCGEQQQRQPAGIVPLLNAAGANTQSQPKSNNDQMQECDRLQARVSLHMHRSAAGGGMALMLGSAFRSLAGQHSTHWLCATGTAQCCVSCVALQAPSRSCTCRLALRILPGQ